MEEDNFIKWNFATEKTIKYQGYTLSKEDLNLVYVPTGKMPRSKANEFLRGIQKRIKELGYDSLCIAVPSY